VHVVRERRDDVLVVEVGCYGGLARDLTRHGVALPALEDDRLDRDGQALPLACTMAGAGAKRAPRAPPTRVLPPSNRGEQGTALAFCFTYLLVSLDPPAHTHTHTLRRAGPHRTLIHGAKATLAQHAEDLEAIRSVLCLQRALQLVHRLRDRAAHARRRLEGPRP
jgi:hypothetical protein